MSQPQKCEHPDITTSKGFEDMIRRFVGLGPSDGLCEWCVYFKDEPKVESPCGDCDSWDHYERAAVRQDKIIAIVVGVIWLWWAAFVQPKQVVETEGVFTVGRVIGSNGPGYLQDKTWTVTFLEKSTTMQLVEKTEPIYSVIYYGGVVSPGQKYKLLRLHSGAYKIREAERWER